MKKFKFRFLERLCNMKKSDQEKCYFKYYIIVFFFESVLQLWNDRCEDVKMWGFFCSNYCFN